MNHFKQIAAQAALVALFANSASADMGINQMRRVAREDPNIEIVCDFEGCVLVYLDEEAEEEETVVDETIVIEFNDGDSNDISLEVGGSVTYEFQSLDYDNCTNQYILWESDSDLYSFSDFSVEKQTSDEGTI